MDLIKLLAFITRHPLNRNNRAAAISRFLRWQFASRMLGQPVALPFVGSTRLVTETGMTGATGNWYCGLHEVDEMGFALHMLRPEDLFFDVGANIGSYSVLAAGGVGARVVSVEPVPATFRRLATNITFNQLNDRVELNCCGLSAETGELSFTAGLDTMNRIALPGETDVITVPVRRLDDLSKGRVPRVMKIDVEGHEAFVLAGGRRMLDDRALEAVLMETNAAGEQFGISDDELLATMAAHGFTACSYDALVRRLRPVEKGAQNTIFVRDVAAAEAHCQAAPHYKLINASI